MTKNRLLLLVLALVLLCVSGYSYYSPQVHLKNIKAAAEARDTERLRELIDFESVRAGLKEDMRSMFMASMQKELAGNPFAGLGLLMMNAMVDPMVDAMISPTSIVAMIEGGKVEGKADGSPSGAASHEQAAPTPFASASSRQANIITEHGYENYTRYRISMRPAHEPVDKALSFNLRREGLFGWKLYRITLPATLFEQSPPLSKVK
jgi:hypothetical protein